MEHFSKISPMVKEGCKDEPRQNSDVAAKRQLKNFARHEVWKAPSSTKSRVTV